MGNKTEISLDFQHCPLQVILSKYNKLCLNPRRWLPRVCLPVESAITKVLITKVGRNMCLKAELFNGTIK